MIYRICERDGQFGPNPTQRTTNVIPTEPEAIVSRKEATSWSYNVPNLFKGKDIG